MSAGLFCIVALGIVALGIVALGIVAIGLEVHENFWDCRLGPFVEILFVGRVSGQGRYIVVPETEDCAFGICAHAVLKFLDCSGVLFEGDFNVLLLRIFRVISSQFVTLIRPGEPVNWELVHFSAMIIAAVRVVPISSIIIFPSRSAGFAFDQAFIRKVEFCVIPL